MTIAVTGSSGLIGSALVTRLGTEREDVLRLVRRSPGPGELRWDPDHPGDLSALAGVEAVVHLAGENIAAGRWTARRRQLLRTSRVDVTRRLASALARLSPPPRTLALASAIGWYEPGRPETLDETAPPAETFLGRLVRDWEAAAAPARDAGIRTVALRFGVVLSPRGGALARMLPLFRLGLGGPLGDGRQPVSWVSIADAVDAIVATLRHPELDGAVNVVAPGVVTQRDFAAILGRVLRRPAVLRAPTWALRLAFGEMADALLLTGARVAPARLLRAGFQFRHPDLEPALRDLLT